MTKKGDLTEAIQAAYKAIDDKFGQDIVVLKVGKISILADYFIIATGSGITQIRAIADEVEKKLHEFGINLRHTEDYKGSKWILLDFGTIIVHLFCPEEREFYNLDAIWRDAEQVTFEAAK